ncbi:MAG TPA: MBL fold metallo-hydrolase [Polyangiaceae bacterium]|nr:MBL fold metallo-hydrolase [Polyangiaceae bacterium]
MDYPRPQQVRPGVAWFAARTPTLPPATHTNSYALGERDVVLVEPATPFEDEQREWIAWARGLASNGRDLVGIVVTHHHVDHVGGASFFADALDLPLWAHPWTAEILDVPISRQLRDGDEITLDGPKAQRWRCLHTPGHAPGHICLHDPESGMLVVGDMVASEGTILVAPGDGDLTAYLEQLRRLADLEATTALPAHGAPIADPRRLFEHYVSHRLMRENKVMTALLRHPEGGDLDALVAIAYDDVPVAIWPLAKLSLHSHLIKLVSEGRAERLDDATLRWRPPVSREA